MPAKEVEKEEKDIIIQVINSNIHSFPNLASYSEVELTRECQSVGAESVAKVGKPDRP